MEDKLREGILKEWVERPSPELSSLIEISYKAGIREGIKLAYDDLVKRLSGKPN